ncbi:hypothetical protein CFC21_031482 [Triticum aestivum]|uniref:SCP domain-containing protein n=2 Tax=Triticum aestivum TaxID=4565 RepID=A0A9R1EWR9_WHEAT|nr:hypothetical protein CFC21_031482 [Triticum aestivum]
MSPSVCLAILLLALASPSPASANIPSTSNNGVAVVTPSVPTATQFLQSHNDARRDVGVAPLTWNSTLEQDAQRYADRLSIGCNGYQDGAAVTASWVNGRRWYDYRANACAPGHECGAYKLVVCSSAQELGCARRTCRSSPDTVAVCSYFPDCDYNDRPY